jgi:hypothetical protein
MNTMTVGSSLEQALQTLQQVIDRQSAGDPTIHGYGNAWGSAPALSNALEQDEPEPVAFADRISFDQAMKSGKGHDVWPEAGDYEARTGRKLRVLYAHPPCRETEQEPVAWMSPASESMIGKTDENGSAYHIITTSKKTANNSIPLYTQPSSIEEYQEAYNYARSIAEAIWKKHYKDIAPHWKPHSDLLILLTQIDNMTATLRPAVL